jgi:hypothetical protein
VASSEIERACFRAMGRTVVVSGGDVAAIAGVFERWEAMRCRFVDVLLEGLPLRRPPGLALDFVGVVTALAVDEAAASLPGPGFVSADGDLAVRGTVDVALPGGGAVRLDRGGLSTQGPLGPGSPGTPWHAVTVSGASCLEAHVAAEAAYLLGMDGPDWLDERGLPGRFVGSIGAVVENATWSLATGASVPCI